MVMEIRVGFDSEHQVVVKERKTVWDQVYPDNYERRIKRF
jgi:hypothetical protein